MKEYNTTEDMKYDRLKIALKRFLTGPQRARDTHSDTFTVINTLNEWEKLPDQSVLIQVFKHEEVNKFQGEGYTVIRKEETSTPNFEEFEYYLKDESK
jgi:hypothetical protein